MLARKAEKKININDLSIQEICNYQIDDKKNPLPFESCRRSAGALALFAAFTRKVEKNAKNIN